MALLVAGLVLVAFLKIRDLHHISRSIVRSMDRSAKRVGLVALVPGGGTALWLIMRGVHPPACVVVGALCTFGVFAVLLSILQMEGMLLETSSEAEDRIARGSPAPSTPRGRVISALVGCVAIGVSAYAISIVIR